MNNPPQHVTIAIIGAGQAGLSAAYHAKRLGVNFVVLDGAPGAGGAWQHRWPSLTLKAVNRIHDLPGLSFQAAVPNLTDDVQARSAVPEYFRAYEAHYDLPVIRPVKVHAVRDHAGGFRIDTDRGILTADGNPIFAMDRLTPTLVAPPLRRLRSAYARASRRFRSCRSRVFPSLPKSRKCGLARYSSATREFTWWATAHRRPPSARIAQVGRRYANCLWNSTNLLQLSLASA